jgi:hypothetical protein
MNASIKFGVLSVIIAAPMTSVTGAADLSEQPPPAMTNSVAAELSAPKSTIWQDGIGNGFLPSAQSVTQEAGVAPGMATFGSRQAHDLALLSASYGHMLGRVIGGDHWYRGNFEGRLELFGGMQFHPDVDTRGWLVGLTPHLRYNFATGTRWIPFVDGGAGVTATGIGRPDLSGTFEFNLQPGLGVHWFFRENLALTTEARYMHMSCAGIDHPNLGVNNVIGLVGLTWLFGK